jgi:hypothetical protein
MSNALTDLYLNLLDFIEPLRTRLEDPDALEYLFYRYGWDATMDDAAFARFRQAATIIAPIEQFVQTAEALRAKLDGGGSLAVSDVAALTGSATALIKALAAFGMPNLEGLADPLGRPEFWESIAEQIFDDLLVQYLQVYWPIVFAVLRVWNVIRYDPTEVTDAGRVAYTRVWVDWGQMGLMLTNPLQALKQGYHWGDAAQPFDHKGALEALQLAFAALRLPAGLFSPALVTAPVPGDATRSAPKDVLAFRSALLERDFPDQKAFYRLGFEVYPAQRGTDQVPAGLMLKPILEGGAGATLPLNSLLSFNIAATISADDAVGLAIFPDQVGIVAAAPSVGASLTLQTTGTGPWYALGNAQTSRIELSGFQLSASVAGSLDDPEFKLAAKFTGAGGQPGAKAVVTLSDSDSFVRGTAGSSPLELDFSPQVVWSSKTGLMFNGTPTAKFDLPLNIKLGPITLTDVSLSLGSAPQTTSSQGVALRIGVGLSGSLGPLTLAVSQLGFVCTVTPYTRDDVNALPGGVNVPALGAVDINLQFAAPTGVGLSIDTGGLTGGGFLSHDDAASQYAGVLQLGYQAFQLQAFGLIATKLPTGPGYSMVAMIDATFPPIQLVAGFTLNGVGGLLGINRSVSIDALEAGIKAKTLSGFLFNKNPIANAAQLLTDLDTFFPAAQGRYVFGPLLQIGWGTPTAVTIDLALILELPDPVRLVLIGELAVLLPNPNAVLIELHMDVLGTLDFGTDEGSLDAVLHDSRIVNYPLQGAMALRGCWAGPDETFLLSVGGFHPKFQPPVGFPALQRLSISMPSSHISKLNLNGYLAVSSNTLQIGAHVDIFVGIDGFGIAGYLNFDTLIERNPFYFDGDISGGVTLSAGGSDIMSLDLAAELTGPAPWHCSGSVHFSLLWFSVTKSFSVTFGDVASALLTVAVDVGAAICAALSDPRSFSATLAANESGLVTLRTPTASGVVLGHPGATLAINQNVCPLGLTIQKFGADAPSGDSLFTITAVTADGAAQNPASVAGEFAPSQFLNLSDDDELAAPSFETFNSGVAFGDGTPSSGPILSRPIVYETLIVDTPGGAPREDAGYTPPSGRLSGILTVLRDSGRLRYAMPAKPMVLLPAPGYVIATTDQIAASGVGAAAGQTFAQARAALAAAIAQNPDQRGTLQVVASYEVAA